MIMSHMELHFAVRLLIIGVALIYVLGPILWHWQLADVSTAVTPFEKPK